jgi:hypothetical protein
MQGKVSLVERVQDSIVNKNFDEFKKHIDGGFDVNFSYSKEEKFYNPKPLCWVAQYGTPEMAEYLIKKGADKTFVYQGDDHATPLHAACNNSDIKMFEVLIKGGVDVNARDAFGRTALVRLTEIVAEPCYREAYKPAIKLMLELGAEIYRYKSRHNEIDEYKIVDSLYSILGNEMPDLVEVGEGRCRQKGAVVTNEQSKENESPRAKFKKQESHRAGVEGRVAIIGFC